jgi:hypothetical protein
LHCSGKWPSWCTVLFSYMFISILYVLRATSCSSSGESIVSIQFLVYVILCKRPSSWYNWFSWWWAWGCSKHVEDWNKHIRKKYCVRQVGHLPELYQDARSTKHKMLHCCFIPALLVTTWTCLRTVELLGTCLRTVELWHHMFFLTVSIQCDILQLLRW